MTFPLFIGYGISGVVHTSISLYGMLSFLQEVLRNKIISEVKQSVVLQEEGSERMKLKDLSDAIFQDIG